MEASIATGIDHKSLPALDAATAALVQRQCLSHSVVRYLKGATDEESCC
jgi:hypothetical protein